MAEKPMTDRQYLFGGSRPWDPSLWSAVDDRVRGGQSQSHLSVPSPRRALFHGTLDITALGGAGFASQKAALPGPAAGLDLSAYAGLELALAGANAKTYTLVLKDAEDLPRRPDGRMRSTVSWEYDFSLDEKERQEGEEGEDGDEGGGKVVRVPFGQFKPTYRGKPKEDAEPLDTARLRSLSVMMRSHFGEQEGEINLSMRSIAAYRHRGDDDDEDDDTRSESMDSVRKGGDVVESGCGNAGRAGSSWFGCFLGMFGGRR